MDNSKKFTYTYKALTSEERAEAERIRSKYIFDTTDKRVKRLKRIPKLVAAITIASGVLIFGTGLTCVLEWSLFVIGTMIAVFGAAITILSYFFYGVAKELCEKKQAALRSKNDDD